MPNKFNAKCRHHIPKMKYTVRNWAEYDAALRARGSLRARHWRGQQAEVAIAVEVLNRMLGAGRPKSVRTLAVVT